MKSSRPKSSWPLGWPRGEKFSRDGDSMWRKSSTATKVKPPMGEAPPPGPEREENKHLPGCHQWPVQVPMDCWEGAVGQ